MATAREQFERWLKQVENIDLEFKVASSKFDDSKGSLFDYCAALSNGDGGKLFLGVQEKPIMEVKGTNFRLGTHGKLSQEIWQRIQIHVDVEEFFYDGKRVLILHVPKHSPGRRIKSGSKGDKFAYPIRRGESLGEMDDQRTRQIFDEVPFDFTETIVPGLTLEDIEPAAIEILRKKWGKESGQTKFLGFDDGKTLANLGLMTNRGITYAGLILAGKSQSITEHLPTAEIIFEYRHDSKQTHHDFRKNWREPFVTIDDEIWSVINARNVRIPFQQGFFQREIWGFDEKSVREAVHNAVMHRDYRIGGKSIFIKASPQEFTIESPGGFPPGITLENILREKVWRNRALSEAFEKIGFAERSSQGMDDIFEQTIRDGKGLPDLSKSDSWNVVLTVPAQVKDKDFILYLERVSNDRQINFTFEEIYELEKIREHKKVGVPEYKRKFLKLGLIEIAGKGRGAKYLLSRHYYETAGQSGKHTRIRGLNRNQIKELILTHIREGKPARREDIISGFPECNPKDISNILQELKGAGKIRHSGSRLKGSWKLAN